MASDQKQQQKHQSTAVKITTYPKSAEITFEVFLTVASALVIYSQRDVWTTEESFKYGAIIGLVWLVGNALIWGIYRYKALRVIAASSVLLAFITALPLLYSIEETGFSGRLLQENEQPAKTLWDWMQLAGIPLVAAFLGFVYQSAQRERTEKLEEAERERTEKQLKQDRRRAERHLSNERLQAYMDKITELILEGKLVESKEGDHVRTLARARTLAVLPGLDGDSKGLLVRFLYEADLIGKSSSKEFISTVTGFAFPKRAAPKQEIGPVIELRGADLRGLRLNYTMLDGASLEGVDLSGAHFHGVLLRGANLTRANFADATFDFTNFRYTNLAFALFVKTNLKAPNFTDTFLSSAIFSEAKLENPIFRGAFLDDTDLTEEQLVSATLDQYTTMPDGSKWMPQQVNLGRRARRTVSTGKRLNAER